MKIAIVCRNLAENSSNGRWIYSLTQAGTERGHEIHVLSETLSCGKVAAAGGQAHVIAPSRWGGAFGRWVFARRAVKELRDQSIERVVSAGDFPKAAILLPVPPADGADDAEWLNRARAFWGALR